MKILLVVGARPNYMKIAPLYSAIMADPQRSFTPYIVHTGQHYDANMSDVFFRDLNLPSPDYYLGVGAGSHAEQTARAMTAFEKVCLEVVPSWVIVAGDVNSTLAASLTAAKLNIRVAHVEAGLRSYDRTMPEEINRIVTDALSDLLLTPSVDANDNLIKEGIGREKIIFVGNIMIDALTMKYTEIMKSPALTRLNRTPGDYFTMTIHRPANLDDTGILSSLISRLESITDPLHCIFPVHPNTKKRFQEKGLWNELLKLERLIVTEPLSYVDFMNLVFHSKFVITDSGGIQEETTYLGIPCITLRPNTERPITITEGTNELSTLHDLPGHIAKIMSGNWKKGSIPAFWDGKTSGRILQALLNFSK